MIFRFDTLDSTMRAAASLAAEDYPHGTAVVADTQTSGIGRHGHAWHSPAGAGLYVSIVLRQPEISPALTLALGIATGEAVRKSTGLVCDLRWPNDVLLAGKKVAGILVQVVEGAAIAGIGINVNHERFPPELAHIATSLRMQSGCAFDREALLESLLASVEGCCEILRKEGVTAILRLFADASSYVLGKRVTVDLGDRTIQGVTAGLDSAGFLLVRKPDGGLETVFAGGVRPLT